ncbi:MAG: sigma-70 family RNA polymerase sigma factor [Actinobacteria bacterium]|nr:sigma-70 family RNA polymerase sigma factor [Acidimicrobiaceae bacterium]MBP6487763.1 sigma-70 family RNA polymerase sigma factor [Ilumatobacteraceae bacterium]NMD23099.1 sigma-70 family RNA polymerase sigma factor [Actinomycetota bacterium]MBK9969416.1 sigma-70 family RNA polymerase sigma factor [Acidimicrobiaceae bacterium]MBP7890889.1 sigma-70 family RNA polymerase sigma factor [Ilumatobacteraceae bacterium]
MDPRHQSSSDLPALVARALERDQRAWRDLVNRLKGVAWKVIYSYDLSEEDRNDAFASTFFRLHERLATVREPEKLPGWVATTARNEANTVSRRRSKLVPMAELPLRTVDHGDHGEGLESDELRTALYAAFSSLSPEHQALMRMLSADPPIGYDEISRVLNLPHGSIGPTRARCLQRLRTSPELAPFLNGGTE